MKILQTSKTKKCIPFNKFTQRNFGIASVYSKYVIIGGGCAGYTASKLLTSNPFKIKGEQITLIDMVPDYTVYPLLKYHALGKKDIIKYNQYLPDIIPDKVRFRNNEVLQLDPKENLILGNQSLRQTYDKLILACGLEPDYVQTPGLLYSLQDTNNPIFCVYEYENILPKMSKYSHLLIKKFSTDLEFKVTKKNDCFIKNGDGNVVFANCTNDLYEILHSFQILILLFDLLKAHRGEDYISTLKFLFYAPISREFFLEKGKAISSFFMNLIEERKITVKWDHQLESVGHEQSLIFKHNDKKENVPYNYSLVMPKRILPSFVRYSGLVKDDSLNINKEKLRLNNYENIFLLGDCLNDKNENFLDSFDINIFNQAQVISNNIKVEHFRLDQNKIKNYAPHMKVYFDFLYNHYLLVDNSIDYKFFNSATLLKKNFLNNFFFKHFYYKPEGYYAHNFVLKKHFGINII